ncbi:MAG: hypothetical protein V7K96_01585 [Nostoc sp.]
MHFSRRNFSNAVELLNWQLFYKGGGSNGRFGLTMDRGCRSVVCDWLVVVN